MSDKMPRGRSKEVTDEEIIEAIRAIDDPCFGPAEVATQLTIGTERTRQRLRELENDDVINRKKIGQRNVYWENGH